MTFVYKLITSGQKTRSITYKWYEFMCKYYEILYNNYKFKNNIDGSLVNKF